MSSSGQQSRAGYTFTLLLICHVIITNELKLIKGKLLEWIGSKQTQVQGVGSESEAKWFSLRSKELKVLIHGREF